MYTVHLKLHADNPVDQRGTHSAKLVPIHSINLRCVERLTGRRILVACKSTDEQYRLQEDSQKHMQTSTAFVFTRCSMHMFNCQLAGIVVLLINEAQLIVAGNVARLLLPASSKGCPFRMRPNPSMDRGDGFPVCPILIRLGSF